jgi:hypothetical protein
MKIAERNMEINTQPELRPDSELRDLELRLLHRYSEREGYVVRPSDFDPPISLHNIYRIGEQLRDREFIKGALVSYLDGWWMRISTNGILYAEQNL